MKAQHLIIAGFVFLGTPVLALLAQEAALTKLPRNATSPAMGYKNGGFGPMGKEMNPGGWLVLNGARFRNVEFPILANTLKENYSRQGYVSDDSEFTQLPAEQSESKPGGEIVRGFAICPSPAICGDLTGTIMPFDLDASL
jgi:hypothetical protein